MTAWPGTDEGSMWRLALQQAAEAPRPSEALELLLGALVDRSGAEAGWVLDATGAARASSEAASDAPEGDDLLRLPLRARGSEVGTLVLRLPGHAAHEPPSGATFAAAFAALLLDNERLAEEARLAEQSREHFLVSLNHELRTPATGLVLVADLLRTADPGDFPELLVEWLGHAEKHVDRIMRVLEGLLEATSALNLGSATDLVEPRRLVSEAMRRVEPAAKKKRLRLSLSFPPDLPLLQTDVQRCARILLHLLDNAVRFSDGGEIRVRLDRLTRAQGAGRGGALQIAVHDPGCGIPADQLERVFEPFAQVEEGARNVEGSRGAGLGLTIARRLARSLGGDISLASEPGHGTTATLVIPYSRS